MSNLDYLINYFKATMLGSNSLYDYLMATAIFLGFLIILKIIQLIVIVRLEAFSRKSKTELDDLVIKILKNIKPPVYLMAGLYVGAQYLAMPNIVGQLIFGLFIFVIILAVIKALEEVIDYLVKNRIARLEDPESNKHQRRLVVSAIRIFAKIFIWSFGLVMLLSNLGVNITSLVAGLGIGGIAVALAMQNILGDLFNSFSIYLDKPFKIGDFIIVGSDMGTVEKIGLKTTRIRTLLGEELIISNTELTQSRIQNFKRMQKRRVAFKIGVTYGTALEKLKQIPVIIKQAVEADEMLVFDRSNFTAYGDFSLDFETVFFINTADYNEYVKHQEDLFLKIYEEFEKNKIDFAFPTQTVHVVKGS